LLHSNYMLGHTKVARLRNEVNCEFLLSLCSSVLMQQTETLEQVEFVVCVWVSTLISMPMSSID